MFIEYEMPKRLKAPEGRHVKNYPKEKHHG